MRGRPWGNGMEGKPQRLRFTSFVQTEWSGRERNLPMLVRGNEARAFAGGGGDSSAQVPHRLPLGTKTSPPAPGAPPTPPTGGGEEGRGIRLHRCRIGSLWKRNQAPSRCAPPQRKQRAR